MILVVQISYLNLNTAQNVEIHCDVTIINKESYLSKVSVNGGAIELKVGHRCQKSSSCVKY